MIKPKHSNRNSDDQVRERLALLISESMAQTPARRSTEPTPIFSWPDPSEPDDFDETYVEVDLPAARPRAARALPEERTRLDAEELLIPTAPETGFAAVDPASGDPPSRVPTREASADPFDDKAGRLVERWVPGGDRAVERLRSLINRHRGTTALIVVLALAAAIGTAIAIASAKPAVESAPALPPAISAMANASTAPSAGPTTPADTHIVVSVVGRVANPGLVTLPDGARVDDAVRAAGGVIPGTDVTALNLARKLADGEQIYVGIPIPPGADESTDTAAGTASSAGDTASAGTSSKKSKKGNLDPGQKINLNTASADELETLPGVGDATAQRIVNWRSQHGSFNSIDQLHDVGGIGTAKFAKLKDLVTV